MDGRVGVVERALREELNRQRIHESEGAILIAQAIPPLDVRKMAEAAVKALGPTETERVWSAAADAIEEYDRS